MKKWIAGIDEVGRGPIAGPVTVCCVWIEKTAAQKILRKLKREGLTDSKKLAKSRREYFATIAAQLKKMGVIDYAVASVSATDIDSRGISYAIRKAIFRATRKIAPISSSIQLYLDGGLKAPEMFTKQKTVIKGDVKVPVISLASCIAKVNRDSNMRRLHRKHSEYGFDTHVGYGTQKHYAAIKKYGLTKHHRKTWIA